PRPPGYSDPGVSQVQTIRTRVRWEIRMNEPASSEERRIRLDLLVDEASMLSFPASDPPAVFVEETQLPDRVEGSSDDE
ncbi:MAG TPA: hypothetical protein VFZ75_03800, partial [Actinomycetota bacterium]|nr:hypothetical protein [Actinomycetota bacterium]